METASHDQTAGSPEHCILTSSMCGGVQSCSPQGAWEHRSKFTSDPEQLTSSNQITPAAKPNEAKRSVVPP